MSETIALKKGFNLNLAGKAEEKILSTGKPDTFALKPTDFQGITRPKLLIQIGDSVKSGTPILVDKMQEEVKFAAPVSGEIVEINRGEKRKLLEIKILADKEVEFEDHPKHTLSEIEGLTEEKIIAHMSASGVWVNLIQRPYGIIPDVTKVPKAIFISAFDTSPLAPKPEFLLRGQKEYFQAGIKVLSKLTPGKVHVNVNGAGAVPEVFASLTGAELNRFKGSHPAGNVGTQIHHLDPINKGEIAWTCSPYGVVQIGKLFLEGKYDASKLVALTGSSLKETGFIETYLGAAVKKLIEGRLADHHVRVVSGNVLTGEAVGEDGHLGFFSNQITVIPEGDEEEFLGWIKPSASKLSFHRSFGMLSFLRKKAFRVTTNTQGEQRGFVMTGAFEEIMPMDILPTYLFKSIMANDYDEMEALGIYELIEEDVALCEFIDVSKNNLQSLLREGIELIRNS